MTSATFAIDATLEELAPVQALCQDMDTSHLDHFLGRMDEEYLVQFSGPEISQHAQMVSTLGSEIPVRLSVTREESQLFTVTVVAFDCFAALSTISGILTSFGFDIQDAKAYTFEDRRKAPRDQPPHGRSRPSPKKQIVDVFLARYGGDFPIDGSLEDDVQDALTSAFQLLEQNKLYDARAVVSRRLVASLARTTHEPLDLLAHIDVTFDNIRSDRWTVMHVHSKNSFGFLYALSNALSLRGIYIHGMRTHSLGEEIHDTFLISTRHGAKLEIEEDQESIRSAATLIKRFTQYLAGAPDPAKAIEHFDRFLDKLLDDGRADQTIAFLNLSNKETLDFLARLLGASDFLWEDFLRMRFETLLPVLEDFQQTGRMRSKDDLDAELTEWLASKTSFEDQRETLNVWKDRETFRIDVRHLLEPQGVLSRFSNSLSALAEVLLERAAMLCAHELCKVHGVPRLKSGEACEFAICGLGKFGGRELGYASDLETQFLYTGQGATDGPDSIENAEYFDRLAGSIIAMIRSRPEGIFHFDTRLRPYGSGAARLATAFDQFCEYYSIEGDAEPYERQSLIKLRWVAGSERLGVAAEEHRHRYVYSDAPWDWDTACELRERQKRELVAPGTFNVKISEGGLIDIEYAVQYLQIVHGPAYKELRTPSTQSALEVLGRLGTISRTDERDVRTAYLFLRSLSDALRIVRGNAKDLILPDRETEAFTFLARRLGHLDTAWEQASENLEHEIDGHRQVARNFFIHTIEQRGQTDGEQ